MTRVPKILKLNGKYSNAPVSAIKQIKDSESIENNASDENFTHNLFPIYLDSNDILEQVIQNHLKNHDNTIIVHRSDERNQICKDVSLIQCFWGQNEEHIAAVKEAIEYQDECYLRPHQHIFIEAQEEENQCQFQYLSAYGMEYHFHRITEEEKSLFLKTLLWNEGIGFATNWKLMFLDADIVFCSDDWIKTASDSLGENDVISLNSKCYYANQEFDGNDSGLNYFKRLNDSRGYVCVNNIPGKGHSGFSIGMTRKYLEEKFHEFDVIDTKYEDLLYWFKVTGDNSYEVPNAERYGYKKDETIRIGSGKSICCHVAHGKISERGYPTHE